jgi:hypothetical protein
MNGRRDSWDEHIIEGNKLFDYMTQNFESFFNGETVKHFNIIPGLYTSFGHTDDITEKYGEDIQKELIIWIKNELTNNNFFVKKDWKPFRDPSMYSCIYLGYRKLFTYRQYYFQVAVEPECSDRSKCIYCIQNENPIHFELVYYGYKEKEENNKLQPFGYITVLNNNVPEDFWNIY